MERVRTHVAREVGRSRPVSDVVQYLSDLCCQAICCERLDKELHPGIKAAVMDDCISGISGGEECLKLLRGDESLRPRAVGHPSHQEEPRP